jgi:hypothetical protein
MDRNISLVVKELTEEQKRTLESIINQEGTGEHPWADERTLPYFMRTYVLECTVKAMKFVSEYPELLERISAIHNIIKGGDEQ